jgi:hypothetical protein
MMKKYWLALIAAFATGCMLDPLDKDALPIWSTNLEIPLIRTEITLNTILEDSLLTTYPTGENGEMIYVFRKTVDIERVEVGNNLKLDPVEKSTVQYASAVTVDSSSTSFNIGYEPAELDSITKQVRAEMGLIEMDNIDPAETAPFYFREIMPASLVTAIETALVLAGDTAEVVVDPIALVPRQKSVAFSSIDSVTVSSGFLDVTIINNLFIPLGSPIVVDVSDSVGVPLFDLTWEAEIPPGDSATLTKDLAGEILPGKLLIIVSGTSSGSHGEAVTVTNEDLDSSFRTRAEARAVQAARAHAIVPVQTFSDIGYITLPPSQTRVEEALLLSGDLYITMTNNLPLTGSVILVVPDLIHNSPDSAFTQVIDLQAEPVILPPFDLAGWTMIVDYSSQQLSYNHLVTTNGTDPEYVVLDQYDDVTLDLEITNISVREITGQIEEQTITEAGDIDIGSDSRILNASIAEGSVQIGILNRIGGVADVRLVVPELLREANHLDTMLVVSPGSNEYAINLNGYDIIPVSLDDQRLTYDAVTVTCSDSSTYDLLDSIDVWLNVSELTFDAVTGYISQADNVEEFDVALDNETKVETALISSGEARLTIHNYIGLEADVLIEIAEMTRDGVSLATSFPLTSSTDPVVQILDLSGVALSLPLDDQRIHYTSTLSIPGDELMSLTLEDSIIVDVLLDTLRFASVSGLIDPVEVKIDTVAQDLSTLPETVDGFDFANVEVAIAFDSDLTIPTFLDLALEAHNASGDLATSSISGWNVTDSATVFVPDAAELVNIRPERILVYGTALVGAQDVLGTVTSSQGIAGMLSVRAPLELEITPKATIITDPDLLTGEQAANTVPDEIEEVTMFLAYDNQFEFGVTLAILMDQDLIGFNTGTADVLVDSLVLNPNTTSLDSLLLNDERLGLFNQDSTYVQARVQVLGQIDEFGQPVPSLFLSTDTLQLHLYGRLQYLVDGAILAGSDQ